MPLRWFVHIFFFLILIRTLLLNFNNHIFFQSIILFFEYIIINWFVLVLTFKSGFHRCIFVIAHLLSGIKDWDTLLIKLSTHYKIKTIFHFYLEDLILGHSCQLGSKRLQFPPSQTEKMRVPTTPIIIL